MAAHTKIGGVDTDRIFIGTDFTRDFHVLDIDTDASGATAKDVTGWAVTIDIRRENRSETPALYSTSLTIIGVFNATAASNTQRLRWTVADTDLTTAIFGTNGGTYAYSVKRTDDGSETVLQWGKIVIDRVTQA